MSLFVLLSPAKNLNDHAAWPTGATSTSPLGLAGAERVMSSLKTLAPQDIAKLMQLSDKLSQLNYLRNQAWTPALHTQAGQPAALLFNGDVYQGLEAADWQGADWAFAQAHLGILSGLYGLLRPLDGILPYRLEMGASLAIGDAKNLYAHWVGWVTEQVQARLDQPQSTLINLASSEYAKVVKLTALKAPIVEPVFKDRKNDQYKIISFYAKKARGMMARFIVKNRLSRAEQLQDFTYGGYRFAPQHSSATQYVFLRDTPDAAAE